jgi:hypothetical protein
MPISMYRAAVPTLVQLLNSLSGILDKAAAHAEAHKIEPAVLIGYRLAPNMYPLSRQIQVASDMAKACVARLAGETPPNWPDTETSFPELKQRLAKTLDYVQGFKPEQIDGSEDRQITIKAGTVELHFAGEAYLTHWVIPNFTFHATTAYAILRHAGVELGKRDFLGSF